MSPAEQQDSNNPAMIALYEQLQNEMRWRRDAEFRMYREAIAISTGALTAAVALRKFATGIDSRAYGLLALIIVVVNLVTIKRVLYENQIYRRLGEMSVRLFERLKLLNYDEAGEYRYDSVLPEHAAGYGAGAGYRMTISVMVAISAVTLFVIYFLAQLPAEPG